MLAAISARCPCHKKIAGSCQQCLGDLLHLPHRFSLTENHFGHAVPQSPVMIHLRKPQILKRHMAQLIDRGVNRCRALAHLLQQNF